MTRRTLFASLMGAPVAAAWAYLAPKPKVDSAKIDALVRATSEMLGACQRIDTYWEGERLPLLFGADGQIVSTSTRTGWTVIRVA